MNQTQGPSTTDDEQGTRSDEQATGLPGVDRHNLRHYEQLHRSVTDRKIAGVAGGLGRHLNVDPTILRVLFVVLCFFGGAGFVLYGAAWLFVPEDGRDQGAVSMSPSTRNAVLIAAGVLAALLLVGDSWHGIGFPWPVFLVGIGALVYLAVRDKDRPEGYTAPEAPAPSTAPEATDPSAGVPAGYDAGYAGVPAGYDAGYAAQPPAPPWVPVAQPAAPYQPPSRRKTGPKLFGFTLALVAAALGALGLYDVSGGDVLPSAYPALALAVIGLVLVLGAFVGRAGGLIFLGLVAAAALVVTSVVASIGGDFGGSDRLTVAPTSASRVLDNYAVNTGRAVVDLSNVRDPAGLDGRLVNVTGRAAELVVILPPGIRSDVTAGIDGPGEIDLPDRSAGGISTDRSGVYGTGTGLVTISTHLSAGHIDVRNP
ncbi:PspC domain-containing protein [Nocardioides panacis]|uniref:PspC domain-containing protein n=1 Tax=Nocardioides panacis TaxID=2849501 RepID=A0A975SVX4_9ACTN|nr:PspC domain-containing protein [Nocardioides panacis]QWZ06866.1 PspC domain-containing protein [Nocardioides panacis]